MLMPPQEKQNKKKKKRRRRSVIKIDFEHFVDLSNNHNNYYLKKKTEPWFLVPCSLLLFPTVSLMIGDHFNLI
jgi:hypothetical protein